MAIQQSNSQHETSRFSSLPTLPSDEPFSVNAAFLADMNFQKVNLGLGVYRSEEGEPWPLPVVEKVERALLLENKPSRHEYTAIAGDQDFLNLARNLIFGFSAGTESRDVLRVASIQTISGTGANHVGASFLSKHLRPRNVWVSDPTWDNHFMIWELIGMKCRTYPYYDASTSRLDFDGMMRVLLSEAEEGDVVILHACAHNPTGLDPTKEQWMKIADICERKRLFPFFDSAYQGFASGNVNEDAWAVRYFFNHKPTMEFCVAQSFSKNFGLYGQRVGAWHLVLKDGITEVNANAVSHMCQIIRGEFSMAPRAGSDIVKAILGNHDLTEEWRMNLTVMSIRLQSMRQALYDALTSLQTPGSWVHITAQIGMFSYTGLTPAQVLAIRHKHHIYMLNSGRISISGLTSNNVIYVAKAIDDVVRNVV